MSTTVRLNATLTCPECGALHEETMPADACVVRYTCRGCGAKLRPQPGDCCVFCSWADTRCPPEQSG